MAHFALLWKARTIEKYRQNYENEKINSIIMSSSDVPDKTLFQRWRHYKHGMQKRLSRTFSKWYPEGSTVSNFFVNLRTDMKLPNILLRSLYGFIGGLLMTYLGFMFFVFQLSVSLMHATVLSSIIGVLLTLGLTFSNRMRCLIFLLIPQLFSRVGRYTLTCYALVLILTGPATNTLKNSEVLSESMACSQEQIKLSVKEINDSIKKPFNSIKDSLKVTIKRMNQIVRKLKIALVKTNKLVLSIASIIQSGYSWLSSMTEACNEVLGSPRQKCLDIMKEHCNINKQQYNYNEIRPNNVKNNNKHIMRDILDAIGIKNVKQRKEEEHFVAGYFKNNGDKTKSIVSEDNNSRDLRDDNIGKRDIKQFAKIQDKGKKAEKPWFCNVANVAGTVCASLQSYEKYCVAADFVGDTFLATIKQKLKTFVRRINALIHVQLNIQHTYTFIGNSSTSNQIAAGIVTEIRNRADPILTWLSWSSCVTSLFLLLIIFRAKHYQHMFETRSRFDNRFITKEFRELDLKRLREGRETVLPLNTRERAKYVTTTSFRLVASEKLYLNRSAVFMTVATFKLLIHIVADYSLFWVLTTIQHHGKMHTAVQPGHSNSGASISGTGFVARLLQAFLDTMNKQLWFPSPDHSCLPNPYPPDVKRYCQIGFLIFLLWFFALFEPYGLRMRHLIMGHYRPQRAKDRAVWLYNHVLRTRASFMKFARRKLHREYKYSSHTKLTLRQCLRTHALLRRISYLLGIKPAQPRCLLCHISEDTSDRQKELIKCVVPNCPGTYCQCCFSDIGELCTICLSPSDYGDFSDVSLEKGSTDESNSENENDSEDGNPSGSYNRKSNSDWYNLADTNDNDGDITKRSTFSKQRQIGYFLGRMEKGSDTSRIPLLQHSVKRNHSNGEKQKRQNQLINRTKLKPVISTNVFDIQHKNLTEQSRIKHRKYNRVAILKDLNNIHTHITLSTMDRFIYSLYEITKNPLQITKSKHVTNMAKYMRKKKLLRQKKCIQRYTKYFMTCSCNNINLVNENTKKTGDNRDQENYMNDLKNPIKDETNNNHNIELKCYDNETEIENIESKNETITSRMRKHKEEFQTVLSKFWKNVKLTVSLDKGAIQLKEKLPNTENKHKRKKKRKKYKSHASKGNTKPTTNKKKKVIGNSRLFAFLDERDWVNCYDNKDKLIHTAEGEMAIMNHKNNDEKIIVNNVSYITIPKLDLNISSESVVKPLMRKCNEIEIYTKKNHQTRNPIERFLKSLDCSSCEFFRSSTDLNCAKDDFHYKGVTEPYLLQGLERGSSRSQKQDVTRFHPTRATSDFFAIRTRKSNPLLALKNRCSSIFIRRVKENRIDNRNTGRKENMDCACDCMSQNEAGAQTVRNKMTQCKAYNMIQLTNTIQKVADEIATENKSHKEIQTMTAWTQMDDKEVTAFPLMISCGCQNVSCFEQTEDFAVQVKTKRKQKNKCDCKDANVTTHVRTCSCAAQYDRKGDKEVATIGTKKNCDNSRLKEEYDSDGSTAESSVFYTDESKTDTTVCTYANVDCGGIYQRCRRNCRFEKLNDEHGRMNELVWIPHYKIGRLNERSGRLNVRVVTKSNQSTLTDRAIRCDASTATYDWWSPLVEKKVVLKKDNKPVEKRRKDCGQPRLRERRTFRNKGMSTGEKIVTFRSKTQFIPSRESGFGDIMSASRYLLESQRYYNELFYNIFASPRVYPVTNLQKNHNLERDRSQVNNSHYRRRGRKTKRLEESFSPRKDTQQSIWMRRFEFSRSPEPFRRSKKNSNENKNNRCQ